MWRRDIYLNGWSWAFYPSGDRFNANIPYYDRLISSMGILWFRFDVYIEPGSWSCLHIKIFVINCETLTFYNNSQIFHRISIIIYKKGCISPKFSMNIYNFSFKFIGAPFDWRQTQSWPDYRRLEIHNIRYMEVHDKRYMGLFQVSTLHLLVSMFRLYIR